MKNNNLLSTIIVFLLIAIVGIGGYLVLKPADVNTDPTPTPKNDQPSQNDELALANEVRVNKSSLYISKGSSETFTITVSGAAGLIEVNSSDENIVTISTSSGDCNGTKCFFDAPTGSESSIEYTVTGIESGNANINVMIEDLLTYDEVPINGSGSLNVTVQ